MQPAKVRRMSALGEAFRTAREARGLSLSDVAEHIHIRSVYLAAIEAEDWPAIGAPVYVRGFIRTYARFLGMDAEAAVDQFADLVPADAPVIPVAPARAAAPLPERRGPSLAPPRRGPSLAAVLASVVAVLLVGAVAFEYYQYRNGARAAPVVARSTPTAAATVQPAVPPPMSATPAPPVAARNQLAIRLTERSWLRVVVDGTVAMEGIFPAGTVRSFTGHTASVRAGNAGGVSVSVDGRPAGVLGAAGDVVERSFRLNGE